MHTSKAEQIIALILSHRRRSKGGIQCPAAPCPNCMGPHLARLSRFIEDGIPVEFVLPAFPVKSPNLNKVLGPLPDKAEEIAVQFLDEICARIGQLYPPGARITICADGRVFGDLIGVPDGDVDSYQSAMATLLATVAPTTLRLFTLDDAAAGSTPEMLRRRLDQEFGESLTDLRQEVKQHTDTRTMYLGIVRFLVEDRMGPGHQGTRSALQRESRERAYGVVARSRAWGRLIGRHFPEAVRLSIHPQPCGSTKLGILLGETPDNWLTPWHSVAVLRRRGFVLMKRTDAEKVGAQLVFENGKPSHYLLREESPMIDERNAIDISRHEITAIEPFGVAIQPAEPGQQISDISVESLRSLVRKHHLVLLRGFDSFGNADELSTYCARWGTVSEWPFGTVLELVEHDDPEDHIFDHSYVPLHWDGMYREQVPEFQVFHCVTAPGRHDGGETMFSNTTEVLAHADSETVALWSKVTGTYRRKMEYYDSVTVSPIVTAHPDHDTPVIRYNEPTDAADTDFVNHPDLEFSGLPDDLLAQVHSSLRAALHDRAHRYSHAWQSGDLVIADNYTLLHGRNAFTSHAGRHLRRVHVLGDPPLDNPGLLR
ncbi:L-tyrosine/L-tryptophan isonitrile synthase family protein [Nocardia sp. NPDC046473]|uniref:L-tyrosine/L-tryptophan isonitrile synthase family protein n=1 Tax=Nocardia sp. NPDC046473 TaxID=3155733 RepID=UPI003406C0CD